jgi:hypothetical protein
MSSFLESEIIKLTELRNRSESPKAREVYDSVISKFEKLNKDIKERDKNDDLEKAKKTVIRRLVGRHDDVV